VKCPDSGEPDTFEVRNLDALSENDEVKFVLSTRRDYEFARDFTLQHGLAQRVKQVLFSPVFEDPQGKWPGLEPRMLVEWILADGVPVRLGLQLHKFIWTRRPRAFKEKEVNEVSEIKEVKDTRRRGSG